MSCSFGTLLAIMAYHISDEHSKEGRQVPKCLGMTDEAYNLWLPAEQCRTGTAVASIAYSSYTAERLSQLAATLRVAWLAKGCQRLEEPLLLRQHPITQTGSAAEQHTRLVALAGVTLGVTPVDPRGIDTALELCSSGKVQHRMAWRSETCIGHVRLVMQM